MMSRFDFKLLYKIPKKARFNIIVPQYSGDSTLNDTVSFSIDGKVITNTILGYFEPKKELNTIMSKLKDAYKEDPPNRVLVISIPERMIFEQLSNDAMFITFNPGLVYSNNLEESIFPNIISDCDWNALTDEDRMDNDKLNSGLKIYGFIKSYEAHDTNIPNIGELKKYPNENIYTCSIDTIMSDKYMITKKEYEVFHYNVVIGEYEKIDLPPINMEELNGNKTC